MSRRNEKNGAERIARIGAVQIGSGNPLALIAGPCVIESREHTLRMAEAIRDICGDLRMPFVFKASFDKANRSSINSFRGPGLKEGLAILGEVREKFDVPVLSDIHETSQAEPAGKVLDCVQIPAFLCRQTDLIIAAARTRKCVNVKKGQFLSPEEMGNVLSKLLEAGCENFLFTERGTFFGYNRLVNDMTSIPRMQKFAPVVFDATHSCQQPGGAGTQSGGERQFIGTLAAAAVAAGADAIFMEVHDDPAHAKSDAATVLPLTELKKLCGQLMELSDVTRRNR
ncbi:MAG: 3-deoxy-8-phosphooctulonate synthase [Planctomycetes bacterium]|nr:3-deoxy-8-phosphooctulonate synthase [Planctomycetota bacterium]MBI3836103.1 3-deoxy-8-phosphooctulonate synthase [Planctomycetota bacterium]